MAYPVYRAKWFLLLPLYLLLLHSLHFLFLSLLFSHVCARRFGKYSTTWFSLSRPYNEFVPENRRCELHLWEIRNGCYVCHLNCACTRAALDIALSLLDKHLDLSFIKIPLFIKVILINQNVRAQKAPTSTIASIFLLELLKEIDATFILFLHTISARSSGDQHLLRAIFIIKYTPWANKCNLKAN